MSVTFGSSSAPSQVISNLDSLFGTSLAAYRKELIDNIGATNAFFFEMITKELYQSQEGGAYIQEPLMYALAPADSYDGYDELSTLPTDGITDAIYQWRQCASPIAYSMREVKQNKQKIINLVEARIKQAEMGLQEYFAESLMWGAAADGASNLYTPRTSTVNGSLSINPLPLLISYTPTATGQVVGNIDQSTQTWWQNKVKTSAATTWDGLLTEFMHTFNSAALGTGGKPKIVLADQITYETLVMALYNRFRATKTDENYPFENTIYKGAHIVMDEKVPDVANNLIGQLPNGTDAMVVGSAFFINPDFFKMIYETDSDFELLKDENGKAFQKPVNGDSRVANVAWMGQVCTSNRRKQAVMGNISRTIDS
jgi:hypothetical protein